MTSTPGCLNDRQATYAHAEISIAMAAQRVFDGQYTQTVYTLIKGQKYAEAVEILTVELQRHPKVSMPSF
jgi:hypothetical protein